MIKTDYATLFGNELFSFLDPSLFERWLKEERAELHNYRKGEAVLTEENFRRCLIVILKGGASVVRLDAEGHRTILNQLRPGDVFGMATLFYEEETYPSRVIAEEPSRMILFPKELIEEAFRSSPDFAAAYVRLLSQKIHFLNEKLGTFTESEVEEKLLHHLRTASNGQKEWTLPCSLSRLAESLGIGRASLYRAFDSLEKQGVLRREGKQIVFLSE